MKIIKGDLIELTDSGCFDVVIHGCNCFCTMGAGIAKYIKRKWPIVYDADCKTIEGDKNKLGTYSYAEIITGSGKKVIIINAYSQYHFGGKSPNVNYDAIENVFYEIAYKFPKSKIAYPKIGSGLAGGNWKRISTIIEKNLRGLDHTLVEYDE